jgi:hypothetical protein
MPSAGVGLTSSPVAGSLAIAIVRFRAKIRFCGRYWGKSGHCLLHRTCPLMTKADIDRLTFNPFRNATLS